MHYKLCILLVVFQICKLIYINIFKYISDFIQENTENQYAGKNIQHNSQIH